MDAEFVVGYMTTSANDEVHETSNLNRQKIVPSATETSVFYLIDRNLKSYPGLNERVVVAVPKR